MIIIGEIKETDTTASKTGNKVTDISNEKIINISGTFTVGNSGAKYGATIYCIIDAYVDGQWINIHQVSQSRPARSSTTFNLDFNTIVYDATQVRVAYSSTDNETSKTWNINIYTGELDVSEFICNDTATIMSYSSRNFIKDVSGFALCGLYYNGTYKGPVVISPTQSVARYSTSGNYTATISATSYVTINGIQWWYTPSDAWFSGDYTPTSGEYLYRFGKFQSDLDAATAIVKAFYDGVSTITWSINPSSSGTISQSGGFYTGYQQYWSNQHNIMLTANTIMDRTCIGWYSNNTKVSSDNPYIVNMSSISSISLEARTAVSGNAILL